MNFRRLTYFLLCMTVCCGISVSNPVFAVEKKSQTTQKASDSKSKDSKSKSEDTKKEAKNSKTDNSKDSKNTKDKKADNSKDNNSKDNKNGKNAKTDNSKDNNSKDSKNGKNAKTDNSKDNNSKDNKNSKNNNSTASKSNSKNADSKSNSKKEEPVKSVKNKSNSSNTATSDKNKDNGASQNKTASSQNKSTNTSAPRATKRNPNSNNKGSNVVSTNFQEPPKETPQNDSLTLYVNNALLSKLPTHLKTPGQRVNSVKPNSKRKVAEVSLNDNFTYIPLSKSSIDSLTLLTRKSLPDSINNYQVNLTVGGKALTSYIQKVDKVTEKSRHNPPFVKEVNPMVVATKGLDNDIIAMWHSHGRYYKNGSWAWQRPILFETAEDVYTMSYILPYVVPMLENAGAYVFLPRERDVNRNEVIVDNDTNPGGNIYSQPYYKEVNGKTAWKTGSGEGFIYDLETFRDTENPFENGTYRQIETQKGGKPAMAGWYADIPEDGEYAVYVSYKTLPNSTTDAHYRVNYSGGVKEFKVNQTMGGGTWIYLGTFPFEEGYSDTEPIVSLSNLTNGPAGTIVTADAVKIGGGMGNIERSPRRSDLKYDPSTPDKTIVAEDVTVNEFDEEGDVDAQQDDASDKTQVEQPKNVKKGSAPRFTTSGMPRYLEGARYWLHWAGFPEYVYSPYHGGDDYKDDYTSRGHWVNYLAGGSRVLPNSPGLNLPVDISMALHSDAGKRDNDTFVGTLGIYYTQNGGKYKDGTPRINSRILTDMVMSQIVNDIRNTHEPNWTRRQMWDKSYLEARVPEVPATLIEFMSHQNYADMMYGLDPNFRFTVSRAIYKGIAKFLAQRKDRKLVIQPLPVHDFAIQRTKTNVYRLSWKPTPDKLEPTAMPDKYIIWERSGSELGFHKIAETKNTYFDIKTGDHDIHSFYIVAANEGGVSFPSETLAFREGTSNEKPALVVNGFTRISAAGHSSNSSTAGFYSGDDFGVPYIRDISYAGPQTEFRRSAGNNAGGGSQSNITQVIAGNTFDFAAVHGNALSAAGYGFVSASLGAVENGDIKLSDYNLVDLILGKQKKTKIGKGNSGILYPAFSAKLQKEIRQYLEKGGNMIISGQYAVSDLTGPDATDADRMFASEVLGASSATGDTRKTGKVRDVAGKQISYSSTLNDKFYIVEKPDVITPSATAREMILSFGDNNSRLGQIVNYGNGRVALVTIPIESMTVATERNNFVKGLVSKFKTR